MRVHAVIFHGILTAPPSSRLLPLFSISAVSLTRFWSSSRVSFFFLFSSDYYRIFYASSDFFRFSLYVWFSLFFFYPDVEIVEQSLYWNEVFYSSNSSFFFKYRCICLQFMRKVLIYLWKIFGRSKNEKNIY